MKKMFANTLFFALVMLLMTSTGLYAQKKKDKGDDDKKARKEWKKKMKNIDPLAFRDMSQEMNSLKGQTNGLKAEIANLEKFKQEADGKLAAKDAQVATLEAQLAEAKAENDKLKNESRGDDFTKGVVYKVQIGAFRNPNLAKYQEAGSFWTTDEDGVKKYTIANFRDYNEADSFKKYIREMGVKDAWIVAYENNNRKDITQVAPAGAEGKKAKSKVQE